MQIIIFYFPLTTEASVILLNTLIHSQHPSPIVIGSLNQLYHLHHSVHQPICVRILRLELCIIREPEATNTIGNGQQRLHLHRMERLRHPCRAHHHPHRQLPEQLQRQRRRQRQPIPAVRQANEPTHTKGRGITPWPSFFLYTCVFV